MTRSAAVHRLAASGLAWGVAVSAGIVFWVVVVMGGGDYYRAPLGVRAYASAHRLLRPSGPVGQTLGVVGTALMLVPFAYMARKRIKAAARVGSARTWLEVHLFAGIVGPVLVTLHTSFKFNGLISAAYWSMVVVVLSGFVGRYLYVQIPRSIRGNELTQTEVEAEAQQLKADLAASGANETILQRIEMFERSAVPATSADLSIGGLLVGELAIRRQLRALDRELLASGLTPDLRADLLRIATARVTLLRRAAYLRWTKKLFELWHVFHLPLVYALLIIAAAHIGLALYMGYVPFRW
jgi:hypothetical protein